MAGRRKDPLGSGDYLSFAEAVVALAVASAFIRFLPFKTVVRSMGGAAPDGGSPASAPAVRTALKRASRRVPWRTVCFQEGLAAHWMLRRRGLPSRLHYGMRQDGNGMMAHVWVTVGQEVVIGEEQADPHVPVASFPAHTGGRGPARDYTR